jgi:hypothetical protein
LVAQCIFLSCLFGHRRPSSLVDLECLDGFCSSLVSQARHRIGCLVPEHSFTESMVLSLVMWQAANVRFVCLVRA